MGEENKQTENKPTFGANLLGGAKRGAEVYAPKDSDIERFLKISTNQETQSVTSSVSSKKEPKEMPQEIRSEWASPLKKAILFDSYVSTGIPFDLLSKHLEMKRSRAKASDQPQSGKKGMERGKTFGGINDISQSLMGENQIESLKTRTQTQNSFKKP